MAMADRMGIGVNPGSVLDTIDQEDAEKFPSRAFTGEEVEETGRDERDISDNTRGGCGGSGGGGGLNPSTLRKRSPSSSGSRNCWLHSCRTSSFATTSSHRPKHTVGAKRS